MHIKLVHIWVINRYLDRTAGYRHGHYARGHAPLLDRAFDGVLDPMELHEYTDLPEQLMCSIARRLLGDRMTSYTHLQNTRSG